MLISSSESTLQAYLGYGKVRSPCVDGHTQGKKELCRPWEQGFVGRLYHTHASFLLVIVAFTHWMF